MTECQSLRIDARAILLNNDCTVQRQLRAWETTVFEILSEIRDIETIAAGRGMYLRRYLERTFGTGRWRKMKGLTTVQLSERAFARPRSIASKRMALVARISRSRE